MARVALCLWLTVVLGSLPGRAAPLFPDVPEGHWAKDAVAALAAKGLVEGYPDGTFKGDRAASRWEVAMVVARLLARMEQEHATFATRAELEELRKLTAALREELDALGVRVTNLEEAAGRLDRRVTELERITFYGLMESRVNVQNYGSEGIKFSDPTDALLDYDVLVGSVGGTGGVLPSGPAAGFNFNPFAFGVFTVNSLKQGRVLVNGAGFTMKTTLGLLVNVSDDINAGAEFAAFTSQGDSIVGLYYGVSAPYLSNAFTALSTITGGAAGTQPANHRPFTQTTLDHFWLEHKPSQTRLVLGAYRDLEYDPILYELQPNPGLFGGEFLDNFGFKVDGELDFDEEESVTMDYQVIGTRLPDRNAGVGGAGYFNHAEGVTLGFHFDEDRGLGRLNFLHAANDASGGAPQQVGLISVANLLSGWVNPDGFFFNQLGGPNLATAGIGSTSDVRPVPMPAAVNNDGITGVPLLANFGNLGPQTQTGYALSLQYTFDHEYRPLVQAQWAHTDYRPNKNSSYSADGDAFLAGVGAEFLEGDLAVDLEYLSVDPRYDPFVLQVPRVAGVLFNQFRMGKSYFTARGDLFHLHDTDRFPHNREGFRGKLDWAFTEDGRAVLEFGLMGQKETSLQDVRFSTGALAPGAPNTPVLGFSPGFTDVMFAGFSAFTFAEVPGVNAFAVPLENPRGSYDFLSFSVDHKWFVEESRKRALRLRGSLHRTNYSRDSDLQALRGGAAGTRGENENFVDLDYLGWEIGADYDVTEDFNVGAGYGNFSIRGHFDPLGVYSNYAESTGLTRFDNFDVSQGQPFVEFSHRLSDSVTWGAEARWLLTRDGIDPTVFPTPSIPALNAFFLPQRSAHPFDWDGLQFNTFFSVTF